MRRFFLFVLVPGIVIFGATFWVAANGSVDVEALKTRFSSLIAPYIDSATRWLNQPHVVPLEPQGWQSVPLKDRLQLRGFISGQPVFIRITKQNSKLDLFMKDRDGWRLFQTYDICRWSGTLGPKIREDRKSVV